MHLGSEHLDRWLLHGHVGHLDIETVEMNALETLANIVRQCWLADALQVQIVRNGTCLMEFSEQVIEIDDGARVVDKSVPIASNFA